MRKRSTTVTAVVSGVAALGLLGVGALPASAAEDTLDVLFEDGTTYSGPLGGITFFGDVDSGVGTPDDAEAPVVFDGQGGWLLTDESGEVEISFGRGGDVPVLGDWDGDGKDEVGVIRGNVYFLAGENVDGGGQVRTFDFGRVSDRPNTLVGDWDGDGADEPVVLRAEGKTIRFVFASATESGGGEPYSRTWGRASTDVVFAADFDGDGTDSLVIQRSSVFVGGPGRAPYFFVDEGTAEDGLSGGSVRYGREGDVGLAADVDGDGVDELGVARVAYASGAAASSDVAVAALGTVQR